MNHALEDIRNDLRVFISENLLTSNDDALVGNNDSLELANIVDSASILELVGYVEKAYGVQVANDEVVPNNFDNIRALAEYVQRKLTH